MRWKWGKQLGLALTVYERKKEKYACNWTPRAHVDFEFFIEIVPSPE